MKENKPTPPVFILDDYDDSIPEKLLATKLFVRVSPEGDPQILRMEPMITEDGAVIPDMVKIFIDEQTSPTVYSREAALSILIDTECVPKEIAMRYKHLMKN